MPRLTLVALTTFLLLVTTSVAAGIPSTTSRTPEYINRIVFIRHAEKGHASEPGGGLKRREDAKRENTSGWWFPWHRPGQPGNGGGGRRPGGGRGRGGPPNGLSEDGLRRAQYIRTIFGQESSYEFGLIFAAPRTPEEMDGERTYATVAPLATDLSLDINIACANSEASCVADAVRVFADTSDKDILISWKHRDLNIIATALGATNAKIHYPDERYDIIWIMEGDEIVEKHSMHMPGLDDGRVDEGDPDLEVEKPSTGVFASWPFYRQLLQLIL